jgi:hypothetical protein
VIGVNPYGYSRVITCDFDTPHADRHAPVTLEELQGTASRIAGRPIAMSDPRYLDRFSDYSRLVERFRQGRVLLAGDAAHLVFSVGGQGLNLGLQDAFNLGWKLALVARGAAPDALLDSYHDERHPGARRVLDNTRAQVALMRPGTDGDALRALFTRLLELDEVSGYLGNMISAQETAYPQAGAAAWQGRFLPDLPLTTTRATHTSVSDLLHAGRPVLLTLNGSGATAERVASLWADSVDTVTAATDVDVPWDTLLLRPDGYIGWVPRGPHAEPAELESALRGWFGEPRSLAAEPAAAGAGPTSG